MEGGLWWWWEWWFFVRLLCAELAWPGGTCDWKEGEGMERGAEVEADREVSCDSEVVKHLRRLTMPEFS